MFLADRDLIFGWIYQSPLTINPEIAEYTAVAARIITKEQLVYIDPLEPSYYVHFIEKLSHTLKKGSNQWPARTTGEKVCHFTKMMI